MNFHQLKQNQEIQNVRNSMKHSKQLHNDMFLNKRMLVGGGLNDYQDYVQKILKQRAEELQQMGQPAQPDYTPADMENTYSSKTKETSKNIDTLLMKIVDGLSNGLITEDMITSIYSCISTLSTKGFLLSKDELENDLIIIQDASNKITDHLSTVLTDPKEYKVFNLAIKVLQRIYFILDAMIKNYVDNEKERKLILQTILKQIKLKQFDTGDLSDIKPSPAFVSDLIHIAESAGVDIRSPEPVAGLAIATGIPFTPYVEEATLDYSDSGTEDDSEFEDAPEYKTIDAINEAIDILTVQLSEASDRADLLPSTSINFDDDNEDAQKEIEGLLHQLDYYEKLKSRVTGTPIAGTPWSQRSQLRPTQTFDDLPPLEFSESEDENEADDEEAEFQDAYSSKPVNPVDAIAPASEEQRNEGDEFTSGSTAPQTESISTLDRKAESNLHTTEGLNDLADVMGEIENEVKAGEEPESLNDRSIEHTVVPAIEEHEALHQQLEGTSEGIQEARQEHDQIAEAVEQGVIQHEAEEMEPVGVIAEAEPVEGPLEPDVEEVAPQPIKFETNEKLETLTKPQLIKIIQPHTQNLTDEQIGEFEARYNKKIGNFKKCDKPKLVDMIIRYNLPYDPIKPDYSKMGNAKLQEIVGEYIEGHEFTKHMKAQFKRDYEHPMGSYMKLNKPALLAFIAQYRVGEEEKGEEVGEEEES